MCSLPPVQGPCEAAIQSWFFNEETDRCELFQYGGCDGNLNNFETRGDCERACGGASLVVRLNHVTRFAAVVCSLQGVSTDLACATFGSASEGACTIRARTAAAREESVRPSSTETSSARRTRARTNAVSDAFLFGTKTSPAQL